MEKKTVLVTGIGGNVGQGIIRNIRSIYSEIKVVGTNVVEFSAGNHLCDSFYLVPFSYEPDFIEKIIFIVQEENIQLIIPSTDYEMYFLKKNESLLGCLVAGSDSNSALMYLDKYETHLHFNKHQITFADTVLPSEFKKQFDEIIVKPRKGRGSRGIHLNPKDLTAFSDDEYMVQRLYEGEELTTAFYVTKEGQFHGLISMVRTLEHGTTQFCKVVSEYDHLIMPIIEKMIKTSGIRGSVNIQSIITKELNAFPFEINCRISGTNSIRSNFGFEDVKYTLQEYLFNVKPDEVEVSSGIAVRVLMDVIYPGVSDAKKILNNKNDHFIF